ncbi:hypothetical protein FOZ60_007974 [Perkinsus olseni]|uniref:Uncharacterized protein n=1 Tax=Perkinsus olseni TaxID=32597 RepID=A0A7J6NKB1_PEROL|nr:hypothetical protein FOZ60_007974 [Perkinsus olseni]
MPCRSYFPFGRSFHGMFYVILASVIASFPRILRLAEGSDKRMMERAKEGQIPSGIYESRESTDGRMPRVTMIVEEVDGAQGARFTARGPGNHPWEMSMPKAAALAIFRRPIPGTGRCFYLTGVSKGDETQAAEFVESLVGLIDPGWVVSAMPQREMNVCMKAGGETFIGLGPERHSNGVLMGWKHRIPLYRKDSPVVLKRRNIDMYEEPANKKRRLTVSQYFEEHPSTDRPASLQGSVRAKRIPLPDGIYKTAVYSPDAIWLDLRTDGKRGRRVCDFTFKPVGNRSITVAAESMAP